MKKYSIEVNEKQLKAMINATDLESRLLSGQLSEILLRIVPMNKDINRTKAIFLLEELKKELFPKLDTNESYGIFSKKINYIAQVLYDIHQAMRYTYSWSNNPEGGFQTWFDDPMRTSKEELPIVKEIK